MTVSRRLRVEPEDMLRAAVPLLLLAGAVALPTLSGLFLLLLVAGVVVAVGRRAPVAPAWAAGVPAAAIATIRAVGPSVAPWEQAGCTEPAAPAVLWALGEAAVVVAITVALDGALGAKPGDLGIRRPPKYAVRWAAIGALLILGGGLAAVVVLARPAFGLPALELGGLAFLLPAAIFAVAVAVAEEVAWRGALQGWLARTLGPWPSVVAQSVLYGAWWGVLLGSPLMGVLAGASGVILGATVVRTRTLAVALAWHAAFNVPFYVFLACQGT